MSDISFIERNKLEGLLGMGGGYVLDFTNQTFQEFVADSTGKDIYDSKYQYGSCSKANRLRAFWKKEPNYIAGKLIADLLEYSRQCTPVRKQDAYVECSRIAQRLQQGAPVSEIEAITPNSGGRDFEILAKSVKDAIDRNEPESGLDRLHTFVVKYIRALCERNGMGVEREKPLHSLIGEYLKHLKQRGLIESEMTERILKSSISVMEAFSRVRNEQSFAHDNRVLNYNESLLILNHVASSIRFISTLEAYAQESNPPDDIPEDEDIPF